MGVSRLLDMSRRTMGVYQKAMDVASHNIANANTSGYSRQSIVLGTERTDYNASGIWGNGVKIEDVTRARNELTDKQISYYNQNYYGLDKRATLISQVESLVPEPSDSGLSSILSSFYNSWKELAVTPNSSQLRNNVIQCASSLSGKIKSIYDGMSEVKNQAKSEAYQNVDTINNALKNISDLNRQIVYAQVGGNRPNDLLDARDQYIKDLSKIVNVNVSYDDKGCVAVSIGGVLAADNVVATEFQLSELDGKLSLITKKDKVATAVGSGELSAQMDVYSKTVPAYQSKIDSIANAVMDSVNSLHQTGRNLNNTTPVSNKFFESYSHGNLAVNQEIADDVSLIAISSDGTTGNGDIATKIGELSDAAILNGKTINENYSDLVSNIGSDEKFSSENATSTKLVLDQLQQQQDSYSGVSIDEEMTNIIIFQRSYTASAKLIKAADEMLQTLINMV